MAAVPAHDREEAPPPSFNNPPPAAGNLAARHNITVHLDNSPGNGILHGQWASPALAEVNGKMQVIAPLGDAWVYGYDAMTGDIMGDVSSRRGRVQGDRSSSEEPLCGETVCLVLVRVRNIFRPMRILLPLLALGLTAAPASAQPSAIAAEAPGPPQKPP